MWQRARLNAASKFSIASWSVLPYFMSQEAGTGLVIQGTREWADYRVSANVKSNMAKSVGIAIRLQGMRRYYALLLLPGKVQLVKQYDRHRRVLAERTLDWNPVLTHALLISARGNRLEAHANESSFLLAVDSDEPLEGGALAMACEEGTVQISPITIAPVSTKPVG